MENKNVRKFLKASFNHLGDMTDFLRGPSANRQLKKRMWALIKDRVVEEVGKQNVSNSVWFIIWVGKYLFLFKLIYLISAFELYNPLESHRYNILSKMCTYPNNSALFWVRDFKLLPKILEKNLDFFLVFLNKSTHKNEKKILKG